MSDSINLLKNDAYLNLVEKRKSCKLCEGLTNPSKYPNYDSNEIGPWSLWQGSLNAEILLVGQDWGSTDYFLKHKGVDEDKNPTNKNLVTLFDSIGIPISGPNNKKSSNLLYFTNVILCLKHGGLSSPIEQKYSTICCEQFLKSLITIIRPKIVIALGKFAFESIATSYSLKYMPFSQSVDFENGFSIDDDIRLFPVYHCGFWGIQKNRRFDLQIKDWQKIQNYLALIKDK